MPGDKKKQSVIAKPSSATSESSQGYTEVLSMDASPFTATTEGHTADSEELTPPALRERGYQITTILGEGGFSKVYRCKYTTMGDKVIAVKIIALDKVPPAWKEKCLKVEMKLIKKLQHPHIIKVWDVIKTRKNVYIFMDLAENDSVLGFMRKQQRPCKEDEARTWFAQTIGAVQYMHVRQVGHRDLKCENILLDRDFNAKLTDFGFACYTFDDKTKASILSMTTCGTPEYQAPEVFNPPYDAKIADLWSMGVVLFEMLTDQRPFPPGLAPRKLLSLQMKKQWKFPSTVLKKVKPSAVDLTSKLMDPVADSRLSAAAVLKHPWLSGN